MNANAARFDPRPASADLETLLPLGQGGMATAYLARTLGEGGFERLVVLKRLNLELLGRAETLQRFLAEARVAARLHHVNVVGTHAVGRDAAGPFIVLDYVEGGTLDDLVDRASERGMGLPVPVVLRVVLDALSGLQAVHEARDTDGRRLDILHRDVTLQNLLISVKDGVTRLADFGVAKSAIGFVNTAQGYFVGKLCYFPPEYLRREPVGPPLDLYALGVSMWLAITGRELWPEESEAQVVRAILEEGVPPLDRYVEVAPAIKDLVARACAADRHLRFRTAQEMASAIEAIDRDCGWVASHPTVAETVKDLLGTDLERRRVRLSELTRTPGLAGATRDRSLVTGLPDDTPRGLSEEPTVAEPVRAPAVTERLPPPPRVPSVIAANGASTGAGSSAAAKRKQLGLVGVAFGLSAVLGGSFVYLTSRPSSTPAASSRAIVAPTRDAGIPSAPATTALVSVGQAIGPTPPGATPSTTDAAPGRSVRPHATGEASSPLRRRNPYR